MDKKKDNNVLISNNIAVLQLNNYTKPIIKEVSSKDWVLNGDENSHFQYLIDRKNGSPTNSTIIKKYISFIYGKGLTVNDDKDVLRLFPKKEVRKIVSDYKLFGSATFQVIYSKGKGALRKVTGVFHIPRETIAPNKMNDKGEILTYWYCKDWTNPKKNVPEPYPAFGTSKEAIEIYEIKPYEAGKQYYASADYEAGLEYCQLEEEISHYSISHIQNGLSAGWVINLNNGIPEKELQDEMERGIMQKVTGSSAAGNVILSFNNSTDTKTTVEPFPQNASHKQWEFWTQEAKTQIMVSHEVTNPILFGLEKTTGFGNNAEEIETSAKFLYGTVIMPYQETILDAFQEVAMYNGKEVEFEFKPLIDFSKNDGTTTGTGENVELSSTSGDVKKKSSPDLELDNFTANALIDSGEDESSMKGYEVVHESIVSEEPTDLFETKLATVVTGKPNTKSEQDNPLFRVRYIYSPQTVSNNSREFCRKMVGAGKVYRREDIEAAGQKVVNAGLGANGSDTYSIWKYKGGVNCKHFWQRRVYLRTNNTIITVNEARRKILELEPDQRDLVRLPTNEKEVAQSASSSNNFWKIN
ncbi:hypothetical protein [Costertonia aggregata]|uniref:Phage portal protein n=1 Tax=Costertonia aggregata TaxID=343403 RepID=A0A7H9ARM4_9FLAO|nr:hypothetical protein [Costertonia aggregata]QLG46057.1 hypothetical protein HYG79_12110 [Costertonia aggregata]